MKLADIEKARIEADRLKQAEALLALIDQGPMRLTVGTGANQAEIVLTAHGESLLKRLAGETLEAMRANACEQLGALGVEPGARQDPVPPR
ncbi:hypothetical protein [uncultured Hoeflea sp.]|uniref:hypothetical protein n=1 Tax=uncultured Hoeflea sp. TaxID=538666 RepID=UPI00261F75ED|nr:hypothetical protein [uncultured Hoeflea sp.]